MIKYTNYCLTAKCKKIWPEKLVQQNSRIGAFYAVDKLFFSKYVLLLVLKKNAYSFFLLIAEKKSYLKYANNKNKFRKIHEYFQQWK